MAAGGQDDAHDDVHKQSQRSNHKHYEAIDRFGIQKTQHRFIDENPREKPEKKDAHDGPDYLARL